jgi:hypothetical protein
MAAFDASPQLVPLLRRYWAKPSRALFPAQPDLDCIKNHADVESRRHIDDRAETTEYLQIVVGLTASPREDLGSTDMMT